MSDLQRWEYEVDAMLDKFAPAPDPEPVVFYFGGMP